jgi:hypothetical protein
MSLTNAIMASDLAAVNRLLQDARVDPAAHDNSAIITACEAGELAIVKRLLKDERVDPSAQRNSAIFHAAGGGFFGSEGHLPSS